VPVGLLGGAFDPPHNGHVVLAREALERFAFERLLVLVVASPGHKKVETAFGDRLELARLAFAALPRTEIVAEQHAYTVDSVRDGRFGDAVFLVGADEFADFLSWRDPDGVLAQVRLAVATRPGYPRKRLDDVLARLRHPDRVEFFEIPPVPVSSTKIRERAARGDALDDLVPAAVARRIAELCLYDDVDLSPGTSLR
jgi:nicotinate-nucleotide adenylyltransferase